MALGARKREARGGNSLPTPLDSNRTSTGATGYGKGKGKEETTAKNPGLSGGKGSLEKIGTQYKV